MTSTLCKMNGSSRTAGILEKEIGGFFQAAAGVEQDFLARNFNAHAEVIVRFQIIDESCQRSDAH